MQASEMIDEYCVADDVGPGELFALRLLQLAIDSHLHPPHGEQIEPGFGLARDKPVADQELPFPDARGDRGHGEFDIPVDHEAAPPTQAAFNPMSALKIVNII